MNRPLPVWSSVAASPSNQSNGVSPGRHVLSPKEYIHTVRLEETKQMLEGSNLPVEAIANEVGYEDAMVIERTYVNHFNDVVAK